MAATGIQPNEEWIRANESAYWMRMLTDANNWYANQQQTAAGFRNTYATAQSRAQQEGLTNYQNALAAQNQAQIDATKAQNDALIQQMSTQQAESMQAMTQAIEQANTQYLQMQEQIAADEKARELGKFSEFGYKSLIGTDDDAYAGELSQFNTYKDFIGRQLGNAGFNAGNLLSGYDISGLAQSANTAGDAYRQAQQSMLANPEAFMNQYGGGDYARAALEGLYAGAQSGMSGYDNQLRNQLSSLGNVYNAYAQLGDVNAAQGSSPQEKVASLFGLQPVQTQAARDVMSQNYGYQGDLLNQLNQLYVENPGGAPASVIDPLRQMREGTQGLFNTRVGEVEGLWNSGLGELYQGYGSPEQMATGQVFNRANQLGGLLSQGATDINALIGKSGAESAQIQSEYDKLASAMRGARFSERSAILAKQAEQNANDYRRRQLLSAANTLNRQLLQTNQETAPMYNIDPLGLSRTSLFS
jgi:hypothetical protein